MVNCYVCNSEVVFTEYKRKLNGIHDIEVVYGHKPVIIRLSQKNFLCDNCINDMLMNMDEFTSVDKYSLTTKIDTYKELLKIQDHVELYDTIRTNYEKLKRLKYVIDRI